MMQMLEYTSKKHTLKTLFTECLNTHMGGQGSAQITQPIPGYMKEEEQKHKNK